MSTIEVSEEVAARLAAAAERRGITVDELVAQLADQLGSEAVEQPRRHRLSFVGIGSSKSGRSARDADEILAEGFGRT
jgi:hypothetical protein